MEYSKDKNIITGRGAQFNKGNRFTPLHYSQNDSNGLDLVNSYDDDDHFPTNTGTQFYDDHSKKIISANNSPDLSFNRSINPYQGCEHGCVYCYARNSHEYWGYSAGLDFERKIIIKRNAADLLEQQFNAKNYKPELIMLSGNTDCYQPIERKLQLTRQLLKVFLKYRHPVSLITKNSLIIRDLDLLQQLAEMGLVRVAITINSLREDLRLKMEPRTATAKKRMEVIKKLSDANIPVTLMDAPIIPGLNQEEIPTIIERAAENGAKWASYTVVRLNGAIAEIFEDWVQKAFPDRASKIMNQIASCHHGKVNDSDWTSRMRGDGNTAASIAQLFKLSVRKYMGNPQQPILRLDLFSPRQGKQLDLF